MKQEDRELLLKDLSARLPYEVRLSINGEKATLYGIDENTVIALLDGLDYKEEFAIDTDEVKPYLRPMSSMTEEEQQKYYDLTHQEDDDIWAKCIFDKMVDFCNEKHLDYRGLIEKGLALEAPKGMYNI